MCVGPGSEYELVERGSLCLGGSPADSPTFLLLAQSGSKIPNPGPYGKQVGALPLAEAMRQRVRLEHTFKLWSRFGVLQGSDLLILRWPDASLGLCSSQEGREEGYVL